ncbi:ATPase [Rossellomorea vietnamensis]|uniref:ATPase n=1 Tax=Rossellomorea vietnamensis TaxID=218284 RepID=A0A5D4K8F1_9BACI|nr:ATPase [Rossellomorea vietnamensis]TYR73558.1 ATPase [Rossellomorea vietnamensis]
MKPEWIPFYASFGTMILLYLIGYMAKIEILTFKLSFSNTEIALLPIAAGFAAGLISQWILKRKGKGHESGPGDNGAAK